MVIAVRVVWLKDAKSVTNCESGCDDQKSFGVFFAVGATDGVDGLPSNQHCHDGRFARSGGELQCQSKQLRVGFRVNRFQQVDEFLAGLSNLRSDFRQPDDRFNGFDLTKERTQIREFVISPMVEQPRGIRCDLPIALRKLSPAIDIATNFIDGSGVIVLLHRRG